MCDPFRKLPAAALSNPVPFTVSMPGEKLEKLRKLIDIAEIGPVTYEGLQQDQRYGITTEWLRNTREQWKAFDWYMSLHIPRP